MLILALTACFVAVGEIVDFESFPVGNLKNSSQWHAAAISPRTRIIDTRKEYYGKALELFLPERGNSNNIYKFTPVGKGVLAVDFDIKVMARVPSLTLALAPPETTQARIPYESPIWVMWDARLGKVKYYASGWKDICQFEPGKWNHVRIKVFLQGKRAGTFEYNQNGGDAEGVGLKWRNPLQKSKPMAQLWLIGRRTKSGRGSVIIDNLKVYSSAADKISVSAPVAGKVKQNRVKSCSFYSKTLKRHKNYMVVLPEGYQDRKTPWPVVFLFHGRGRNERSLTDNSTTREALFKAKFVTVLPDGDDGWYINSPVRPGDRYNDYIEELIKDAGKQFNISSNPAERGLSGWSMGGYGCTMFAESHSSDFSALAPVIGLLDFPRSGLPKGQSYKVPVNRFGKDQSAWRKLNPINKAACLSKMKIMIITGQKSFDRTMNLNFADRLKKLNIPYTIKMLKGGHTFATVTESIPIIVDFMNKNLYNKH
jgi:S-formylglutathione hydrolase FrmB